ncbi:MAG TPA: tetratricopeptide repeat protein [Spirochaetota bacterium]|mgnify:CR=1 FL=1|nr:tetratricopeptide repeat protein [Spirochaetota bacterium]HOM10327.1 tetratricopeptide repeat protein [Spirochaetota bacterium]HPP49990.1 tetratricopeptide repeat protein [Spirochaetota bacterium]
MKIRKNITYIVLQYLCTSCQRIGVILFIILFSQLMTTVAISQNPNTIAEINKRAQEYYDKKELSKAIIEWLKILEIDPNNEEVQRKIELVYEEKHKKDISLQRAKLYYRLSRKVLPDNVENAKNNSKIAIENFIIAYRMDPNDPELQVLREDLKLLDNEIKLELAKKRMAEEIKKKYYVLLEDANKLMLEKQYEDAIKIWDEILRLVPLDTVALEGKRQAELAISNRLKYEKIMMLIASGEELFKQEKYIDSRNEFLQVLNLDAKNRVAKDYISKIDDILEEKRTYEQRRIQAEQFYVAGINNLKTYEFDQAKDNFENALALIDNYKDAKAQLEAIPRLKKEYEEQQRLLKLQKIDKTFQEGLLALTEGRYRDAIAAFQATLTLDPKNELAKRYLSTALDALRVQEEEVVDENNPYYSIVQPLIESGKRLYNQGNYDESRKQWQKILNLFPQNRIATEYLLRCDLAQNPESFKKFADNIVNEGKKYLADRKFNEAYRKFELIASIDPQYPEIQNLMALSRVEKKKAGFEGTDEDFRRRYNVAMQLYQQGGKNNLQKALAEFRVINNKYPEYIQVAIIINKIESQLRFEVTEEREIKKLTPRQQELVREYYFKGINYYSNNQFELAITEWRKVLAIDPTHEKAKNNIKKCLILLGR